MLYQATEEVCLFNDLNFFFVLLIFEAGQKLAEYGRVKVNDGVGYQASTFLP